MQSETTKKQRITIGILCIPLALFINAFLFLVVYRLTTSGFNLSLSEGTTVFILLLLGILFTRTAYMLLRYPNGNSNTYLIHPYIVFGLCVLAFMFCLISLGLVLFVPEIYSNQQDFKFGKTIVLLIVVLPVLAYGIKAQYEKIHITRSLNRSAATQPPVN